MSKRLSPPQLLVLSFLTAILVGSVLLMLPWSSAHSVNYLTALFTSTSAVCVTGLVVEDTGTFWSPFGQVVIMLLIQFGGLGLMSFATFFALMLGRKIHLRQRIMMQQSINLIEVGGVVNTFRHLLLFTFLFEAVVALILTVHWTTLLGFPRSLWFGIFHAVSAFNNAGFDLFGGFRSLTSFTVDPVTSFTIAIALIVGGLGWLVIEELMFYKKKKQLSLHSRIVLITTLILIVVPTVLIFATEYNHALKELPIFGKVTASFFQAVTPRTAGFNTIDLNSMFISSQFLIIILMFIGGSPGSTAGGIKTSTFALLCVAIFSQIRGKQDHEVMEHRIPVDQIMRALTVISLSFSVGIAITFLLSLTQDTLFIRILFEVFSALGTVGLSLGLTPDLDSFGRFLIILTMFLGRVGPLTMGMAFAADDKPSPIRYPEGKVLIG